VGLAAGIEGSTEAVEDSMDLDFQKGNWITVAVTVIPSVSRVASICMGMFKSSRRDGLIQPAKARWDVLAFWPYAS